MALPPHVPASCFAVRRECQTSGSVCWEEQSISVAIGRWYVGGMHLLVRNWNTHVAHLYTTPFFPGVSSIMVCMLPVLCLCLCCVGVRRKEEKPVHICVAKPIHALHQHWRSMPLQRSLSLKAHTLSLPACALPQTLSLPSCFPAGGMSSNVPVPNFYNPHAGKVSEGKTAHCFPQWAVLLMSCESCSLQMLGNHQQLPFNILASPC